jgi:hypothetical protein
MWSRLAKHVGQQADAKRTWWQEWNSDAFIHFVNQSQILLLHHRFQGIDAHIIACYVQTTNIIASTHHHFWPNQCKPRSQMPAPIYARSRCRGSYDNVLSIDAIHGFPPPERLLQCTKGTWSRALHVTINPLVIVLPHALKHLETAEIVEEAALALDLNAALSHNSAVLGVDAFCANDEERPE